MLKDAGVHDPVRGSIISITRMIGLHPMISVNVANDCNSCTRTHHATCRTASTSMLVLGFLPTGDMILAVERSDGVGRRA